MFPDPSLRLPQTAPLLLRLLVRFALLALLGALGLALPLAAQQRPATQPEQHEWLALSSKGISPTVFKKSGIGTANAVAEARVTRREAQAHCENWEPGNLENCIKNELAEHEGVTYRASADCTRGRITAAWGESYTLAGVWGPGIGQGRTRWRDAKGAIVARDNASGGLAIAQQWELLCPGPLRVRAPATSTLPAPRTTAPPRRPQ